MTSGRDAVGRGIPQRLRRLGRGIRWYVTTLMGDRAYDTYLAHHRIHHPSDEPLAEREFWRERMAERDRSPSASCC